MTPWHHHHHPYTYRPNTVHTQENHPQCYNDYKKMTLVASITTIVFSVLCIGFLVNELMVITQYIDSFGSTGPSRWRRHVNISTNVSLPHENETLGLPEKGIAVLTINETMIPTITDDQPSPPASNVTDTGQPSESLLQATITKVMYTAFICLLVILMISSVALLKGVHRKKQSLILAWILLVIATIIYAGIVVARDLILLGSSARMHAKLAIYLFFIVLESNFLKPAVAAFRDVRKLTRLRRQGITAVFDPRNPDSRIFTIADNLTPQSPDQLFKLPSYDEVITESGQVPPYQENPQVQLDAEEGTSHTGMKDARGDPPPYEPPEYTP